MTNYNDDTYFTVKTDAGSTTIMYTDISAVTARVVSNPTHPDPKKDEMFEYDIHMNSGTIFTTRQRLVQESSKDYSFQINWQAKWLEMNTLRVKEEIYG